MSAKAVRTIRTAIPDLTVVERGEILKDILFELDNDSVVTALVGDEGILTPKQRALIYAEMVEDLPDGP